MIRTAFRLLSGPLLLLCMAALLATGCADMRMPASLQTLIGPDRAELAAQCMERAARYEETGQDAKALPLWRTAAALQPDNPEAAAKADALAASLEARADGQTQKGDAALAEDRIEDARAAYRKALMLVPDHGQALKGLRSTFASSGWKTHTIRQGETAADVAKAVYGGVAMAPVVAAVEPPGGFTPGTTISLPPLASLAKPAPKPKAVTEGYVETKPDPTPEPPETLQLLERAEMLLRDGNLERAIIAANAVLNKAPDNAQARALRNRAYLTKALQSSTAGDAMAGAAALQHVDYDYVDPGGQAPKIRTRIADSLYRTGVKYFTEDNLKRAAEAFSMAVSIQPEHEQAKQNLDRTRELIKKLEDIE